MRVLLTLLVALALPACTTTPSALSTASESPSGQPTAAQIELGDHAAGRYTHEEFTPRIEVEVPDGWLTYHLSADFFDVGVETDEGPVVVMFLRPAAFVTPQEERQAASPAEAIELLSEHPGATVSPPRAVEIGNIEGLEVFVTFAVDNTHVMRVTEGLIGFGPQNEVRMALLAVDGAILVIGLNAPAGRMDEAESLAQLVIDSIRIGGA